MTGCPNGCARPYNSDIGLVGRSAHVNKDGTPGPGTYTIFLGGRTVGDRLNTEFKDYVPYDQVVAELVPVFSRFKAERNGDPSRSAISAIGSASTELARSASPELNPVGLVDPSARREACHGDRSSGSSRSHRRSPPRGANRPIAPTAAFVSGPPSSPIAVRFSRAATSRMRRTA